MRIDKYISEKLGSRNKAKSAVLDGLVLVNGKRVNCSYEVEDGDHIEIIESKESFVSVGGFKLSKALKDFKYDPSGKVFADVGASTGGFTDCLLQNGVEKVYCIDVGESQLDKKLKDKNVVVIDGFNARNLNRGLFAEELDGIVIDVSFISLTYILGAVSEVLSNGKDVFALIKPQFECESRTVGKNGIVRDRKVHERIIGKICDYAVSVHLSPQAITDAPIVKGKNIEYVIHLKKNANFVETNKLLKSVTL